MKLVCISGVKFGYEVIKHILERNYNISVIFSYNKSVQEKHSDSVSFKNLSNQYNIRNVEVDNINNPENIEILKAVKPDLILVMGWSQILKAKIIEIPSIGIIGSHPTELPKYRGRAPIPWSIIKGLKQSAETFFWIAEGTDSGDILDQQIFLISDEDDANSIYNKVTEAAKVMIIENLDLIERGIIRKSKQDETKFLEYWPKRTPEDGKIDWTQDGKNIHRLVRASTKPYPGAFTFFKGSQLIIWKVKYSDERSQGSGVIMSVNDNDVKIGTGKGVISLIKVSWKNNIIVSPQKIFSKEDIGVTIGG